MNMTPHNYLPSFRLEAAASKLQRVLYAPARNGVECPVERGRLSAKHICRALNGHRDIYKRPWTQDGFTTFVGLVVDMSDSMSWSDLIYVTQAAARAIVKTCEKSGNPVAVWGFMDYDDYDNNRRNGYIEEAGTTRNYGSAWNRESARNYMGISDHHEATLVEFKSPKETYSQAFQKLGLLSNPNANSGTPAACAMYGAADLIAQYPADRRILMMLTDGADNWGEEYVQRGTRYANSLNVETVGVSVGHSSVSDHIHEGDYNAFAHAQILGNRPKLPSSTAARRSGIVLDAADPLGDKFFSSLTDQLGRGKTRAKKVYLA